MIPPRAQQALLACGVGLLAGALVLSGALEGWERGVFDHLARLGAQDPPDSAAVAIVMLDEASLDWGRAFFEHSRAAESCAPQGAWRGHEFLFPWDRGAYALLAEFCALGGASVLALDVEFSGPHPSGEAAGDATLGLTTLMQNEVGAPFVVHALNFESAAGEVREVVTLGELERTCLGGAALEVEGWRESGLPFERSDVGPYSNPILPYRTILEPFAGAEQALRLGAVTVQADPDGVVRRARLLVAWDGWLFPSLGLAAALAHAPQDLALRGGRLVTARGELPLTASGDLLLRWRDDGREDLVDPLAGRYPTYPAHRVLRSAMRALGLPGWEFPCDDPAEDYFLDPSVFAGRIVFLGGNAAGLRDMKATPVSKDYPGVKVHAEVAEALLDGVAVFRPLPAARALFAAVVAACALLLTTRLRSLAASGVAVLVLAALLAAATSLAYLRFSWWTDAVAPLLGVGLAYSSGTTWQWFTAGRRSREITGLFQHFAPPEVVEQLIAHPEDLFLRGETREITSFFSDIRGFTELANAPGLDPSRFTEHLNAYLSEMTAAIHACGGTVDKYIGDAVVAIFGAPVPRSDHAAAACRAALLCSERVAAFNARAVARGLPAFVTRIGLCSGDATVGCVGSRERFSYTAIGATVNFASRMEGVNKTYGTLVLAEGSTRVRAGAAVRARLLDRVRVPGLLDGRPPLEVHELLGEGERDQAHLAAFEAARGLYEARRFSEAAAAFAALGEDGPARVLYDRCLRYGAASPPEDWDGSFRLDSK